jgi:hypothetical protein
MTDWIPIVAPFLSGAFGAGLVAGLVKATIVEHARRISAIEMKLKDQVDESRCDIMRKECREGFRDMIKDRRI